MHESILYGLEKSFYSEEEVTKIVAELEKEVVQGKTSPYAAAQELLERYFKNLTK